MYDLALCIQRFIFLNKVHSLHYNYANLNESFLSPFHLCINVTYSFDRNIKYHFYTRVEKDDNIDMLD